LVSEYDLKHSKKFEKQSLYKKREKKISFFDVDYIGDLISFSFAFLLV
jgi:hypothetical protein